MIKIFTADTKPFSDRNIYDRYYRSVSAERREKTDRLRFEKDRFLSVGAYALLSEAMSGEGLDLNDLAVEYGENGKPYFRDSDVFFNLSHSETKVMCVVSDTECGCDTERISGSNLKIAKRFFFGGEYEYILSKDNEKDAAEAFCRLWTLKESFIKVTGRGLALPLNSFSVNISDDGEISLEQSFDSSGYFFHEVDYDDGFRYACCVKESSEKPVIKKISF